ncbi:MAG: hypothetical protein U0V04_01675 [Spirosomataceae bacterium]|jgi:hypothetical protein
MKRTFILLLFLINYVSFAQKSNTIIKLSPLGLIDDINFPCIQLGVENKLTKKLSIYNEFGFKYTNSSFENNDTSFANSKGIKYKIEIRKYRKNDNNLKGLYYAMNIQYNYYRYNTQISFGPKADRLAPSIYDNFLVSKRLIIPNILIGKQIQEKKHLILDYYLGAGLRFRNIKTTNREFNNLIHDIDTSIDVTIQSLRNNVAIQEGNSVVFNLATGIRVGYKF